MRWIKIVMAVAVASVFVSGPVLGAKASRATSALTARAYEQLDQGDVTAAKSQFIDIIQLHGGDQQALLGLATCLYLSDDSARAKRTINIVLQRNESSAYAHALMGNILLSEKDVAGAEQEFRRAIREDPKRASFRNNLGVLLREKGDLSGAQAAFLEALEQDSGYAEANYNLAALLVSGENPDYRQAKRYYRAAKRAGFPADPTLDELLK